MRFFLFLRGDVFGAWDQNWLRPKGRTTSYSDSNIYAFDVILLVLYP